MSGDTTVLLKTGDHSLVMNLNGPQQRRSCLIVYSGSETGNFGAAEVSQGTFIKVDTTDGVVVE